MTRSAPILLLVALAMPATAQTIYKCVDANGGTLISNTRVDKNCKAIVSSPENSMPVPKGKASGAAGNPTPAGFPKVQEDTQKARDNDRKHILEQEMASEQRNLDQAKKELAQQQAMPAPANAPERIAPYRDRVGQHERNIQAIQKELSNLH